MGDTYLNPVHRGDFPDPFVIRIRGVYWAYCSGMRPDGRAFGVLRSSDLVHWVEVGGALVPLPASGPCYWAPEVVYRNGRCFLYYSVGDATHMEIRVATSDAPEGPFVDSGHRLTAAPFAIDPHVFEDTDGQQWLFYATDFLDDDPVGTGTVCDRLVDPFTLEGAPSVVTRAQHDWQVYDPARSEKGGVRWHTVEGPFVLRHKNLSYQMFSGGNWTGDRYGVGYATSAEVRSRAPWMQHCDGVRQVPVLRTTPPHVIGPGHNSAVRGPDGFQMFCVYHSWSADLRERQMAIDRLDWAGERLIVLGPTHTPQPSPTTATVRIFDADGAWRFDGGDWALGDDRLTQREAHASAIATRTLPCSAALIELWLRTGTRALDPLLLADDPLRPRATSPQGAAEISLLLQERDERFSLVLHPHPRKAEVHSGGRVDRIPIPQTDLGWPHAIRLQLDAQRLSVTLDERLLWRGTLTSAARALSLRTHACAMALEAGRLTVGWEETFSPVEGDQMLSTWDVADGQPTCWNIDESLLRRVRGTCPSTLLRGPAREAFELVVNLRARIPRDGSWGIIISEHEEPFRLVSRGAEWGLQRGSDDCIPLPADFEPTRFEQLRFRRQASKVHISLEGFPLATCSVTGPCGRVGIEATADDVQVDLVRFTALPS